MVTPKTIWIPDIEYEDGIREELIGTLVAKETYTVYLNRKRSLPMAFQNLTLYAGNNKKYILYVQDENMKPVDLTGGRAVMSFRRDKDSPVVITKDTDDGTAEFGAANNGEIFFYLVPSDTATLETGRQYVFDVKFRDKTGNIYTVFEGVLNLLQPVSM